MLSQNDIIFELDALAHAHRFSQDVVKDALLMLINNYLREFNITRLDTVIIKPINLFEQERGLADYKNHTIVLSNKTAYNLVETGNSLYLEALSVLKHELYHFQDYQNLIMNLTQGNIREINDEIIKNFQYWSEFYATFSTFNTYEDTAIYESFESIFKNENSSLHNKKYYTARLFGYYLHDEHSKNCDVLIKTYLCNSAIEKAKDNFKVILNSYPIFTTEQMKNVGSMIDKLINKKLDYENLIPISPEELFAQIRKGKNR